MPKASKTPPKGKSKSPRSSKKKTASSRFISDEADESDDDLLRQWLPPHTRNQTRIPRKLTKLSGPRIPPDSGPNPEGLGEEFSIEPKLTYSLRIALSGFGWCSSNILTPT
ncbi:hypothetical protein C8F04DRAFT_1178324 [Mycena alexandri]|uniref:Uncharacterized protein n=1 Tax=Mycena alexandri TaxID=1745969 RepID=A0AAD6T5S9_9AGAR|nr:hypothetical protein C8F04DRAFT_1178324 [Mycena alexandri]